jgi:hypothetical protein
MKLYAAIANCLNSLCRQPNAEVRERIQARLNRCIEALPNGSGFDLEPSPEQSGDLNPRAEYLIVGSYHKMDEHGCYDGWVDFTLRVYAVADLCQPWDVDSLYEHPDEETIEYVLDTYAEALNAEEPSDEG